MYIRKNLYLYNAYNSANIEIQKMKTVITILNHKHNPLSHNDLALIVFRK